jgi:hypothetical protein
MEPQNLTEPLKALLLKIATELKKYGWKANVETSEIDIHQGHIPVSKEYFWKEGNPGVTVSIELDFTFKSNQPSGPWFIVYDVVYNFYIDSVDSTSMAENSDVDIEFTEQDVNNLEKIVVGAKQLNSNIVSSSDQYAEEFSQENHGDWDKYNKDGWKYDR